MIESTGEMQLEDCNDMNVPVNIFIDREEEEGNRWVLTADNFMPRKQRVNDGAYRTIADDREELSELIKKHVLPLYEAALNNITGMISGESAKLYYWS